MAEPFILKGKTPLPMGLAPKPTQIYDETVQLWVNVLTGQPIIAELSRSLHGSQFGETTQTRAPEGADQPITVDIVMSQFGETTLTKTSGEGADQSVQLLQMSQFGETSLTETGEGADTTESVVAVTYAVDSII